MTISELETRKGASQFCRAVSLDTDVYLVGGDWPLIWQLALWLGDGSCADGLWLLGVPA